MRVSLIFLQSFILPVVFFLWNVDAKTALIKIFEEKRIITNENANQCQGQVENNEINLSFWGNVITYLAL